MGAGGGALNADRASELEEDGARIPATAAEEAVEAVLATQRSFELNVSPALALEALFVRVSRSLGRAVAGAGVQR